MERMTLQVMEVVSMLLVRAGIETHPGPAFRMYLVSKPLLVEPISSIKIFCAEGGLNGDFGFFSSYSSYFKKLLGPSCSCPKCENITSAIYLPDFSVQTLASLTELLTQGEDAEDQSNKTEKNDKDWSRAWFTLRETRMLYL